VKRTLLKLFIMILPVWIMAGRVSIAAGNVATLDETFWVDTGKLFTVDIDITVAELTVRKGDHGDRVRVVVEYNPERIDPKVTFNDRKNRLSLDIDCDNLFTKDDHDGCHGGSHTLNDVRIELPAGPGTDIDAEVKVGEIVFILGDLAIENFRFRSFAGETTIDFDAPNRTTLECFDVNCSVGETTIKRLGNAHLVKADINGGVGEMTLDFTGDTRTDARVRIDLDFGETEIIAPDRAGIDFSVSRFLFFTDARCPEGFTKKRGRYYSANYDTSEHRYSVSISPGIGELKIREPECALSEY